MATSQYKGGILCALATGAVGRSESLPEMAVSAGDAAATAPDGPFRAHHRKGSGNFPIAPRHGRLRVGAADSTVPYMVFWELVCRWSRVRESGALEALQAHLASTLSAGDVARITALGGPSTMPLSRSA